MIKRILSISVPYGFENGSFSSGASWCSASWRCSRRRDRRKRRGWHDSDVSGIAWHGYGHGAHRRDIALRRGERLRAGQILRQKSLDRRLYRAASQHGFGAPTFGARFAALFALARGRGDDDADRLVARRHDGAHLAASLHFARGFSRRRREVSDVGQRFVYVRVPHRAGVFFQSHAGAWDAGDLVRDVCGLGGSSPCFSRADTLTASRLNLKRFEQIIKAKIFMQI